MSLIGGIAALATLAVDVATTVAAIKKIKAGGNSAEIAKVTAAMERQLRNLTAVRLAQLRRRRRTSRDAQGRFI